MSMPTDIPKSVRLARYLEQLAQLRTKSVHDLRTYPKVLWLGELPEERECFSRHRDQEHDDDPDLWIEVRRRKEPRLPKPPSDCNRWVNTDSLKDHEQIPQLRETILAPTHEIDESDGNEVGTVDLYAEHHENQELHLSDHPEIVELWTSYVESEWKPWAAERSIWQSIQRKYTKLFEIHSLLQTKGEQLELLVGVGCLGWRVESKRVERHVVTARVALSFDEKRGVFQIRAESSGTQLGVELDMLPAEHRPAGLETTAIQGLESAGEDIWDRGAVDPVLHAIAHRVSDYGEFQPDQDTQLDAVGEHPVVAFAPALILRQRTQRSVLDFLRKLREQLEQGVTPPTGWSDLSEDDDADGDDNGFDNHTNHNGVAIEPIYLPLPVNEEQKQILNALRHPIGALVQGPPGTGKSHTIANLICHLLATGKRILITAQTPRALQVLSEKLPEEIRPLAVSLLGAGADDRLSLEKSVQGITRKLDDPQASSYRNIASKHEDARHNAERRAADLRNRQRAIREKDTLEQHITGYRGTAEKIAKTLAEESSTYSWLVDKVPHNTQVAFDPVAIRSAIATLSRIDGEQREQLCQTRPVAGHIVPTPEAFRSHVTTIQSAKATLSGPTSDAGLAINVKSDQIHKLRNVIARLQSLQVAISNAEKRPQDWIGRALIDVLTEQDRPWFYLHGETERILKDIRDCVATEDRRMLTVPEGVDWHALRHDADILRAHCIDGGSARWWLFKSNAIRRCKYLARDVRIDGSPADTADALAALIRHADTRLSLKHIWKLWNGKATPLSESLAIQVQEVEELQEALDAVLDAYRAVELAKEAIATLPDCAEPAWQNSESRTAMLGALARQVAQVELADSEGVLKRACDDLLVFMTRPDADLGITENLLTAIQNHDVVAYSSVIERLERLKRDEEELTHAFDVLNDIRSFLPRLVAELEDRPADPEWDSRLDALLAAVRHAQARHWLDEYIHNVSLDQIERHLRDTEKDIQQHTVNAAACLAWAYAFDRMEERHRRALMSWQQAIKALGKGTGKYAYRHRKEAQLQLQKCQDAIPAWIMPLHRVFDSINPYPGMFDVIIIDEASQCGPDSLPLFFIGQKVLIVGDDKQISPSHVGVNREYVVQHMQEYLDDFEHRNSFDLERSLFDHGEMRIGNRVVLREHFRCMPEIIRFSNDLCYRSTPLIPLRQYPPERLAPLVAQLVDDGFREGQGSNALNRPEADRLVNAVVACCQDPAYTRNGKKLTMGVISLLGWKQAEHIEHLLLERLGAEELAKRHLLCGDAYSFQGDERDVIFLSMVAARNSHLSSLTKFSDEQRFNVAASRARDQLWIFHSVLPADLGESCVRRRLLEHFLNPDRTHRVIGGIDAEQLQKTALRANRQVERQPNPFGSWFEIDVALRLSERGLHIVPQHEVGGYFIDLVIEGRQAQLAIECDGDHWHGPEQYDDDLLRQRRLERAGWSFVRVRSSLFYTNPDEALRPVWERLEDLGILTRDAQSPEIDLISDESPPEQQESGKPPSTIDAPPVDFHPPFSEPDSTTESQPGKNQNSNSTPNSTDTPTTPDKVPDIEPYAAWTPTTMTDPREASMHEVMRGLLSIIQVEGPVYASRVYGLYANAAGLQRVGSALRSVFNKAISKAIWEGLLEQEQTDPKAPILSSILRPSGAPAVRPRTAGPRTFWEIPPSEIAWVMRRFMEERPHINDEELYRLVIEHYGFQRLRGPTRDRLIEIHYSILPQDEDLDEV